MCLCLYEKKVQTLQNFLRQLSILTRTFRLVAFILQIIKNRM